jgi:hypothetical protein
MSFSGVLSRFNDRPRLDPPQDFPVPLKEPPKFRAEVGSFLLTHHEYACLGTRRHDTFTAVPALCVPNAIRTQRGFRGTARGAGVAPRARVARPPSRFAGSNQNFHEGFASIEATKKQNAANPMASMR